MQRSMDMPDYQRLRLIYLKPLSRKTTTKTSKLKSPAGLNPRGFSFAYTQQYTVTYTFNYTLAYTAQYTEEYVCKYNYHYNFNHTNSYTLFFIGKFV